MRDYSKLLKVAKENNGILKTELAVKNGIPKDYLKFAVEDGLFEKVARGIYVDKNYFTDNLYILQQICPRVIFSAYTTALLFDLTTRDTEIIYATTPLNYTSQSTKGEHKYIVREPNNIYNLGITKTKTMFGNEVVCHDIHRTICDLFSAKYVGDKFVQVEALKNYLNSNDKDITKLMSYAKKLGVDKELRAKLEVLL